MTGSIVYVPGFPGTQRHGGAKRTRQIREMLSMPDVREIQLTRRAIASKCLNPFLGVQVVLLAFGKFRHYGGLRFRLAVSATYVFLRQALRREGHVSHAVIEFTPILTCAAPECLADEEIPYSLFSHNIESLTPGLVSERDAPALHRLEVDAVSRAVQSIAISGFDASILDLFNDDVKVLPYFPPAEDLERLRHIGSQRSNTSGSDKRILVVGSASNPPTRRGLARLLQGIEQNETRFAGFRIEIVGHETERYFQSGEHYQVLGSVSDDDLADAMMRCRCIVACQPPTTGFLTRIVESNLAGIPILLNQAYRQASGLEDFGVYTYADWADLAALVTSVSGQEVRQRFELPAQEARSILATIERSISEASRSGMADG